MISQVAAWTRDRKYLICEFTESQNYWRTLTPKYFFLVLKQFNILMYQSFVTPDECNLCYTKQACSVAIFHNKVIFNCVYLTPTTIKFSQVLYPVDGTHQVHCGLCNLIQPYAVPHVLALCKLALWLAKATRGAPVRSRNWQIRGRDYTAPAHVQPVAGFKYTAQCVHWLQINMWEAHFGSILDR